MFRVGEYSALVLRIIADVWFCLEASSRRGAKVETFAPKSLRSHYWLSSLAVLPELMGRALERRPLRGDLPGTFLV